MIVIEPLFLSNTMTEICRDFGIPICRKRTNSDRDMRHAKADKLKEALMLARDADVLVAR